MSNYIDRDAAIAIIEEKQKELCPVGRYSRHYVYGTDRERFDAWQEIIDALEASKTEGVEEVVRCKDCKYFGRELENGKHDCTDFNLPYCRPDDFCSHGVQKEATSTDE